MNNLFNELDKLDITSILTEDEEVDLNSIQETSIDETVKTTDQANVEAIAKEFSDIMAINGSNSLGDYSVEQATELTESIMDRLNIKGEDKLVESVLSYIGIKKSSKKLNEAEESKKKEKDSIKDLQSKISALNSGLEGLEKTDGVSKETKFEVEGKEYTKASATAEVKRLQKRLEKLNQEKNKDLENGFGDTLNSGVTEAEESYTYTLNHLIDNYEYPPEIELEDSFKSSGDSSYFTVCTTVRDAERFNYHSDYWGSAEGYQEEAVELLETLEEFMGEVVKIEDYFEEDGLFILKGVAIDKQYNSISHMKVLVSPYEKVTESENLDEAIVNPDVDNIDQESKNKATIDKAIKIAGNKNVIDNDTFREMRIKLSNRDYSMVDRLKDYALLRGEEVIYTWLRAEDENLKENVDVNITDANVNINKDDVNVSVDLNTNDVNLNVTEHMDEVPTEELPVEELPAEELPVEELPVEEIPDEEGIEEAGAEVNLGAKVDVPDDLASMAGMALLASEEEGKVKEEVLADPKEAKKLDEEVDWGYYDKFESLIDEYMPDQGEGETLASQLVTAVNKLIYKWYNDGDVYDNTYNLSGWANDLSDYANWLAEYIDGAKPILDKIKNISSDSEYEDLIKELADELLDADLLKGYNEQPKEGSIYDCDGEFEFSCGYDEYEDDYYDDYEDEEDDEEYDESQKLKEDESKSFEGTKADIMKKHPELANDSNYASYADDDWMAVDYNDDGSIKGLRLADKKEDNLNEEEEVSFEDIVYEMEAAESYEELYNAADKIVNDKLRQNVIEVIEACEKDGDDVSTAYSVATSEYLDMPAQQGELNEEGFQVDNVPGKVDQGKRIELAKLENEDKVTYRVSYLNEADEEIVGWDIDADSDEEAMDKLDAFQDADEVADDILGQEFKDSGVDGVSSLFYKGANISLAADDDSFMITIDKDGEDPVILNGETSNDVMSALILWYIMNTSSTEDGLDTVEDTIKTAEDTVTGLEPADDLDKDVETEEPAEEIEEAEDEGTTSIEVELPYDLLDEVTDFDEDTDTYTLKGEYADIKITHIEEPRETNYDDTEFFRLDGDSAKISQFLDEYDLRDNI